MESQLQVPRVRTLDGKVDDVGVTRLLVARLSRALDFAQLVPERAAAIGEVGVFFGDAVGELVL
jgi:hypothetical protein